MLTLYLVALALGGTFLLVSLILGGKAEADADHDISHDIDVDHDIEAADADADADADGSEHQGIDIHGVMTWLPFASVRFWMFFTAFFGLTGALATLIGAGAGETVTLVVALITGYLSGFGAVFAMRRLTRNQTNSAVSDKDYIGATGLVMLPIGKDKIGKIRLMLKGRVVEILARTDDAEIIDMNQDVIVYALGEDDHVLVTRNQERGA